jgi:hypothetical protein
VTPASFALSRYSERPHFSTGPARGIIEDVTGREPWLQRPRARLDVGQHRLHLALVWLVVLLLWAGGVTVSTAASGSAKLLGALAVAAGVAMATAAIGYLRRPVKPPTHRPGQCDRTPDPA